MTRFRKVKKLKHLIFFSVKLSNEDFGLLARQWEDMVLVSPVLSDNNLKQA